MAPVVSGLFATAHLQPRITAMQAQALCAALRECDLYSVPPRTSYSSFLARRLDSELDAASAKLAGHSVAAKLEVRALRGFVKQLRSLDEKEAVLLFLSVIIVRHARSGSQLGDFFALKKSRG